MRFNRRGCLTGTGRSTWIQRVVLPVVCTLLCATGTAQEVAWQGEIVLTTSISKTEYGRTEMQFVEERWTNFRALHREAGDTGASLEATWTVQETRSYATEDCSGSGQATGNGMYPWFMFEVNPFDELNYMIFSGGYGGGPDATGIMTVRCRNQDPYSFEYEVHASWLHGVSFPNPVGLLDDITQEEFDAMPQETRELMLELDALLRQEVEVPALAITGHVDPAQPQFLRGSAREEIDGGVITITWDLTRPVECDASAVRERLAHEAEVLREAHAADTPTDFAEEIEIQSLNAGARLNTASVTRVLSGALERPDYMAFGVTVGTNAAGLQPFVVRLSESGRALPPLVTLQSLVDSACVEEGSLEGARTMMIGSVQWSGRRFRLAVRIVEVETGVILKSTSEDGSGGAKELRAAIKRAFSWVQGR